jgi:hypothetical protein
VKAVRLHCSDECTEASLITAPGGLCGSIRNFTSAIAVAIYTATLNNRLDVTIPKNVAPVALRMGLPEGSLEDLYMAVQGKASYDAVQGLTPAIKAAVQNPWQEAFIQAGSTVFLVSAAFSGAALILTFFFQKNDPNTMNFVASNVHGKAAEQNYQQEFKEHRRASLPNATHQAPMQTGSTNEQAESDAGEKDSKY